MAATTDDTTVQFEVDGERSEPIPLDEFEERARDAADRLQRQRAEEAHQLREKRTGQQLTFNLGAGHRNEPDFATLKIAGQLGVTRDLLYQEHVTITVTDQHGELIATSPATVGWPAFKDKTTGELTFTERAHTATLD